MKICYLTKTPYLTVINNKMSYLKQNNTFMLYPAHTDRIFANIAPDPKLFQRPQSNSFYRRQKIGPSYNFFFECHLPNTARFLSAILCFEKGRRGPIVGYCLSSQTSVESNVLLSINLFDQPFS